VQQPWRDCAGWRPWGKGSHLDTLLFLDCVVQHRSHHGMRLLGLEGCAVRGNRHWACYNLATHWGWASSIESDPAEVSNPPLAHPERYSVRARRLWSALKIRVSVVRFRPWPPLPIFWNATGFGHHRRTIGAPHGAKIDRPSDYYMDAARFGRCSLRAGIEVRLQSYIRPTSRKLGSAWPWWNPLRKASSRNRTRSPKSDSGLLPHGPTCSVITRTSPASTWLAVPSSSG